MFGAVIVGVVLWVDRLRPLTWVHLALWLVVTFALAIGLMRPLKAVLIAQQYRHRVSEIKP